MLTIAYSAKHQINARFAECLMTALNHLDEFSPTINTLVGKSNIAHARSMLVTEWYDNAKTGDHFMFIDTDQTFTPDDIRQVIRLDGDLKAGLYANRSQQPTSCLKQKTEKTEPMYNIDLQYAATGFLCFTYDAAKRIYHYMKTEENLDRVIISDGVPDEENVIPFFHPLMEKKGNKNYWLGEDFSFSLRARKAGLTIKGAYLPSLGHEIPVILYTKTPSKIWPKKSIVYYCGESRVQFGPEKTNMGGSEQAIVHISQEFAKKGYTISVYGKVAQQTSNNVEYKPSHEFNPEDTFDILILWRRYGLDILPKIKRANKIFVDLHDPTSITSLPKEYVEQKINSIFVKSQYHRNLYPQIDDSKFTIIPNGLKPVPTLTEKIDRMRNRFCYTSSYDRGLIDILKHLWPKIKAKIPDAIFHIYYGSDLLSDTIKDVLNPLLKQPGVYEHGRSDYYSIHKEHLLSLAKIYITDCALEIDCLSIREAAYSKCIPIMSTYAVFSERAGIHIEGDIKTAKFWDDSLETILKLYNLPDDDLAQFQTALQEVALTQDWETTANLWITEFSKST
jgi:hypothetical protein